MGAKGLAWGAAFVMVLGGATAQAATKAAATPASGTAGAAAAPSTTTPPPTSSGAPAAAAAPQTPPPTAPPVAAAPVAPVAPEAAAAPAPAAAPDMESNADDDEEEEDDRPRRKRKHRRHKPMDWDQPQEEPEASPAPATESWRLVGQHFILSAERLTNVLAWSTTQKIESTGDPFAPSSRTTSVDLERSGLDVSFLGAAGVSNNLFSLPRVGFDGMFSNGLTLGGSISYVVTSGKHESLLGGSNKTTVDDPSVSVFVFAPRVGIMIPASPIVGIWLRGGITRLSASSEVTDTNPNTNTDQLGHRDGNAGRRHVRSATRDFAGASRGHHAGRADRPRRERLGRDHGLDHDP